MMMAYDDSIDDSIDDLDCLLHQVAMHEAGLRGSFFPATVIRVPPSIKSAPRDSPLVLVEYDTEPHTAPALPTAPAHSSGDL